MTQLAPMVNNANRWATPCKIEFLKILSLRDNANRWATPCKIEFLKILSLRDIIGL